MAEYRLPKNSWEGAKLRTEAYQFTIESKDDPLLLALKKEVKRHNKAMRALARQTGMEYYADRLKRVRLMPRGPRVESAWADYKSKRAYDSYLPFRHGVHFDVYLQKDDKAYQLIQELRYGITPGIRARLDRQRKEEFEQKIAHMKEMKAQGMYEYHGQWMTMDRAAQEMLKDGLPASWVERVTNA